VVGLNAAVKVSSFPAASVVGIDSPETVKPVPDADIFVIVRFPVPLLVTRMVWESVVPIVTPSKFTGDGVTSMDGVPLGNAIPVPSTLTVRGVLSALVVIEYVPASWPATNGANLMANVTLAPAFKLSGAESPVREKPNPCPVTFVTVTSVIPVFDSLNECDALDFMLTFPKLIEVGDTLIDAVSPLPADFPVAPTHAAVTIKPARASARETPLKKDPLALLVWMGVTDLRPPPGMWTRLMTDLDCHVRKACRATGQGYTRGTGRCTCPRGQPSTVLSGRGSDLAFSTSKPLLIQTLVRDCLCVIPRVMGSAPRLGSRTHFPHCSNRPP
jgi:hypothetical protein